jgi:hypothetical protein
MQRITRITLIRHRALAAVLTKGITDHPDLKSTQKNFPSNTRSTSVAPHFVWGPSWCDQGLRRRQENRVFLVQLVVLMPLPHWT